jgi:dihydrofolate reductase
MRNLIYAVNVSIDGCCDHTKLSGDDETHYYHQRLLQDADVLLYGRITYQLMVPFWPDMAKNNSGPTKSMNDFAQAFDAVKKIVVFSKSLENNEGDKTTIIRSNLKEEIIKLKKESGKSILVGGVDLPSQLIHLRLVDEVRILIQPTIVGEGRRLFNEVSFEEKLQLKLVETKSFQSGVVAMRYLKA